MPLADKNIHGEVVPEPINKEEAIEGAEALHEAELAPGGSIDLVS